jgi:hypothetical protein
MILYFDCTSGLMSADEPDLTGKTEVSIPFPPSAPIRDLMNWLLGITGFVDQTLPVVFKVTIGGE